MSNKTIRDVLVELLLADASPGLKKVLWGEAAEDKNVLKALADIERLLEEAKPRIKVTNGLNSDTGFGVIGNEAIRMYSANIKRILR